jgi:hypothetical protein
MYVDDVRVRRWMRMTRSDRFTDVVLWGLQTPCAGEDHVVCSIEHQLSAAARLFKSHALAAVGEPTATVEPTETLLTTTGRASKR